MFCFELFSSTDLASLVNVYEIDEDHVCVMLADMAVMRQCVMFGWTKEFLEQAFTKARIHPVVAVLDGAAVSVKKTHIGSVSRDCSWYLNFGCCCVCSDVCVCVCVCVVCAGSCC